jgi:hypothetical protein
MLEFYGFREHGIDARQHLKILPGFKGSPPLIPKKI